MAVKIDKLDKVGLLALAEAYGLDELSEKDTAATIKKELNDFGITDEFLAEEEAKERAAAKGGVITSEDMAPVEDNNVPAVDLADHVDDADEEEEYVTIRVPKSRAADAKAAVLPRDKVLMKMVRENFYYEVKGYSFSKQHPFVLVDSATADYLVENEDGFRPASPKEAQDFYS